MVQITNNMWASIELTDSQKALLDTINSSAVVSLKESGSDGDFLVENGLCQWVLFSDKLIPLNS